MRVHIIIDADSRTIPFDHQPLLVGTIHKWLGRNNEHGKTSLFSFSWLDGGRQTANGLNFIGDSNFFVSAHDSSFIKKLIEGVQTDPEMFNNLRVRELVIQENPDLTKREKFLSASPIFIKRRSGEKVEHILYDNPLAGTYLKETLQTKMDQVGLLDDTIEISFDTSYINAGTKKITYKGVENKASWCPVIIKGKPETKLFAWNVGLGNSTGIGFGAIK